jgi:hypothetical protein
LLPLNTLSFSDQKFSAATALVVGLDLVYKFVLLEGGVDNPKRFQIIPDIKIPFTCLRLEIKSCLEGCTYGRQSSFFLDYSS